MIYGINKSEIIDVLNSMDKNGLTKEADILENLMLKMSKKNNEIVLPKLPYNYDALEPFISKNTLINHHTKHHKSYIDNLNIIIKNNDSKNKEKNILSINSDFSFNYSGHILHSLYWESFTPKSSYKKPSAELISAIESNFNSFEDFKNLLKESSIKIKGSGWGALIKCGGNLFVGSISNHENNLPANCSVIFPFDVWEHAYYLDYQSNRATFFDKVFDNIINWEKIEERLS